MMIYLIIAVLNNGSADYIIIVVIVISDMNILNHVENLINH